VGGDGVYLDKRFGQENVGALDAPTIALHEQFQERSGILRPVYLMHPHGQLGQIDKMRCRLTPVPTDDKAIGRDQ
jgi:hypothetical protein